jgi:uncharacterized protein with GYD domain
VVRYAPRAGTPQLEFFARYYFLAQASDARGANLPSYVVLCNLTPQGVQNVKEIPQRRERPERRPKIWVSPLREGLMTMGQYDVVLILEAPE